MLKSFPKILTIFFLTMFILQMIFLFFLLAAPVASQAAKPIEFKPQVGIPGAESGLEPGGSFNFGEGTTAPIAKLVRAIYNYGIGIVGILAAVVLMFGGVLWIVAGGNSSQVGEAKLWIGAALTGLLLALTSYLILNTVNPALVNLTTSTVPGVAEKAIIMPGNGKLDQVASQAFINNLTKDGKITVANGESLNGMNERVAAGIAEVKNACDAFYGLNNKNCEITVIGGTGGDPTGQSFVVSADHLTNVGSTGYTLGYTIFEGKNSNITKINATKAYMTSSAGIKYQLEKQTDTHGTSRIVVTVVPS